MSASNGYKRGPLLPNKHQPHQRASFLSYYQNPAISCSAHPFPLHELEEEEARTDFRKKFLSVTLPRDKPFGGGKPPNYHLGAKVYDPNFCARQLGCPQLIRLKSYRRCNCATLWRDSDDLDVHKDCKCSVNKINNSVNALYPSWELNSCNSGEFDTWWEAHFTDVPDASTVVKTLFENWNARTILAEVKAKKFIVHLVKSINAQVIEDPSMTSNLGRQSVQAGEVVGEPLNSALKPVFAGLSANPFFFCAVTSVIAAGDLELPFEVTQAQDSAVQSDPLAESSPPPSKARKLRKKVVSEPEEKEEPPTIPAEIIVESIELAKKQQEAQRAEPTSSKLALFDDVEVEKDRTTGTLAVMTSPLKPPIVAISVNMPIHSIPSSPATASFADLELAEFEAMDLDAQLDRLEQLSSIPSKAKSKAVDEAVNRVRLWQSTELDLYESGEAIDQLMQDLDLLHR
ncbi:unnamed protein product [Prunus armeniaca]